MPINLKKIRVRRGDVVLVDLNGVSDWGNPTSPKPCVVIQNDVGNDLTPVTIVATLAPISHYRGVPVHVPIHAGGENIVNRDSMVNCNHLVTINTDERVKAIFGTLPDGVMADIDKALKISLGLK